MTIDYDFVDPPTSVIADRAYLLNDVFDTGSSWVRTTIEGFTWKLEPNNWLGDPGTFPDETPIVSNTIQPYAIQAHEPHAINTASSLSSVFALELDIAINRSLEDGGNQFVCDLYFNLTNPDGDAPYEHVQVFCTAPGGTNMLSVYYESYSPLDFTDATIDCAAVTENMNATIRAEIGATTVEIFLNGVSCGSTSRLQQTNTDALWFFGTFNQTYADSVWRRVTIYDGSIHYAIATDDMDIQSDLQLSNLVDFSAAEGVTVTQSMIENVRLDMAISGTVDITETVTPAAVLNEIVSGQVVFTMTLPSSTDQYEGWVVNANTFAPSRYEGFGFNSFARVGNTYLGAKYNGVFELDGVDDAGVDIDASILLAKEDFGSSMLKAMPTAVLGVAANGDMYLRVVHENSPSYTYRVNISAESMRNARVDIGRRMALRYWQLEVYNANGADFELESMKLYPVVLNRRITER